MYQVTTTGSGSTASCAIAPSPEPLAQELASEGFAPPAESVDATVPLVTYGVWVWGVVHQAWLLVAPRWQRPVRVELIKPGRGATLATAVWIARKLHPGQRIRTLSSARTVALCERFKLIDLRRGVVVSFDRHVMPTGAVVIKQGGLQKAIPSGQVEDLFQKGEWMAYIVTPRGDRQSSQSVSAPPAPAASSGGFMAPPTL
ncbi:MAG: hypothetical protein A3B23_01145 [Candidatus Colwellbacteria bacterium RIFCSPLOWO2_01_FULL_48_10]|uniref:Uncharacterized protein n=1 Tax=Candidatus Colwellbacteria bacterium RIFCSPLOWO2_01_FULL_48_10 TaxID=1797690 RepID=A0A1G1Z665_9BACT|nr:MAG: hypothetical protein A3B23_01145 [Candidatus Colwellbacteria bacterium RIFCSPLOWO2_01_FULL_48_10]